VKILRPEEIKVFPEVRELSEEEMKEAYALAKAAFTIEDLLRYTDVVTDEVPADDVLAEMDAQQKEADEKRT
jgi:hypothetical protein